MLISKQLTFYPPKSDENRISTTVQIRLGRVEGNKMVNAKLINNKLIDRAVRIFMERNPQYTDYEEAKALILKAGSVKKAEEQKL